MKKHSPKIWAIIICITILFGIYFISTYDNTPDYKEQKLTAEKTDSIKKIFPEEILQFLFSNDSINICNYSLAGLHPVSMEVKQYPDSITDITIYYTWNKNMKNWLKESRNIYKKGNKYSFYVHIKEGYDFKTKKWFNQSYDSTAYDSKGWPICSKSEKGIYLSREDSEDGATVTYFEDNQYRGKSKTVKTVDPETGSLKKQQIFHPDYRDNSKWLLIEECFYESKDKINTKREIKYNEQYPRREIVQECIKLNDSMSSCSYFAIDSAGTPLLTERIHTLETAHKNIRKDTVWDKKGKINRTYKTSLWKTEKLIIDSSEYYYTEEPERSWGHFSYKYYTSEGKDSLSIYKYWKNKPEQVTRSTVNKYPESGKSEIENTYKYSYTETKKTKVLENYRITFTPDSLHKYTCNGYWDEESLCFKLSNIRLFEFNKKGKVITEENWNN